MSDFYFGNSFSDDNYLMHYGRKGMKWGEHIFSKDVDKWGTRHNYKYGGTIKKGQQMRRVVADVNDPIYDNKRYVSTNKKDNAKWEKYLGESYRKYDMPTFTQYWGATNNIKVMGERKSRKTLNKMLRSDPNFKEQFKKDVEYSTKMLGVKPSRKKTENISRNIAMQTTTGRDFLNRVREKGYGAIYDKHGSNNSKSPVIILDPNTRMERITIDGYSGKLTPASNEWLKQDPNGFRRASMRQY